MPLAWGKIAPNDSFSLQGGKLPTLIGADYMYTSQNMNIERALLWNQEPIVSRGVQANYTTGPLAMSLSLNDGFYSSVYNWVSGSASYTIDKQNTITVVGGGNFDHTTAPSTLKTPLALNNSAIINLIFTYNATPWTITPYFQYTNVPRNPGLGFGSDAPTYGGAILANNAINDNVNLAGRFEYYCLDRQRRRRLAKPAQRAGQFGDVVHRGPHLAEWRLLPAGRRIGGEGVFDDGRRRLRQRPGTRRRGRYPILTREIEALPAEPHRFFCDVVSDRGWSRTRERKRGRNRTQSCRRWCLTSAGQNCC